MIQLLFLVLFAEGAVALILMWKIWPLRELAMKGLDQLKIGKDINKLGLSDYQGHQVSLPESVVEMEGICSYIAEVTCCRCKVVSTYNLFCSLYSYIEEVENLKKESQRFKNKDATSCSEIKKLNEEVTKLKEKLQRVESESEEQEKRAETAEAHVASLQKQSEKLLLEYDRSAKSFRHRLYHSKVKPSVTSFCSTYSSI